MEEVFFDYRYFTRGLKCIGYGEYIDIIVRETSNKIITTVLLKTRANSALVFLYSSIFFIDYLYRFPRCSTSGARDPVTLCTLLRALKERPVLFCKGLRDRLSESLSNLGMSSIKVRTSFFKFFNVVKASGLESDSSVYIRYS